MKVVNKKVNAETHAVVKIPTFSIINAIKEQVITDGNDMNSSNICDTYKLTLILPIKCAVLSSPSTLDLLCPAYAVKLPWLYK